MVLQLRVPAGRHRGHVAGDHLLDVAGEPSPPGGYRYPQRWLGKAPGEHQVKVVADTEHVVRCRDRIRAAL
jgi:hypothetical protein